MEEGHSLVDQFECQGSSLRNLMNWRRVDGRSMVVASRREDLRQWTAGNGRGWTMEIGQ